MPNLFSMLSSQNGSIKLFGGGKQLKSLVPLIDTARCFKFMEEKNDINNEIFNVSKDSVTVEEVADLCKKFNPKVKILKTNDKVPNPGYSLSNEKLLGTGFNFLYSLNESIKEMISKWLKKDLIKDLEYVKDGEDEYVDKRGKISNHELTEPITIGLITPKGTRLIKTSTTKPKCLFTKDK